MAAPIMPQKVSAIGKDSWFWAPAVADMSEPTEAEGNAVSGLNLSCFLLAEQEGVTGTAEKVALARLLCETATTESLGEQSFSLADLQGVFDPQAAANADGKKAYELFRNGATGFLIRRQAVKANTSTPELDAGQFVDVFRVEVGIAVPGKSSTGSDGIYTWTAPVALLEYQFNVAVTGGA